MAQIHKTSKNHLEEKAIFQTLYVITSWLICFGGILTGNYILILAILPAIFFRESTKIYKAGAKGEKQTLKYVKKLDDTFHVFPNVLISYEDKESELDLVVVGRPGIFVIEIKNLKGDISGELEDTHWVQHKTGRKGTKYTQKFYNPTKQVGTHVYRLSKKLKEKDIYTWVQGVVFFTNNQSKLQIGDQHIPILKNKKELLNFFKSSNLEQRLTDEEVEKIVLILEKNIL